MGTIRQELERIQTGVTYTKEIAQSMGITSTSDLIDSVGSKLKARVTPISGFTYTPTAYAKVIAKGSYLKSDITINGITASSVPASLKETKTITPTTSDQTVNASSGKVMSSVTVKGVSVSLPASSYILSGKIASVSSNGTSLGSVSGSMSNNGAISGTLSSSKLSYTVPAGYTSGGTVSISAGTLATTGSKEKTKATASNAVTGMTTASSGNFYVTLSTTDGKATAYAVNTAGAVSADTKYTDITVGVTNSTPVTYIKAGSIDRPAVTHTMPSASLSLGGISYTTSRSDSTDYAISLSYTQGAVDAQTNYTEGYVKGSGFLSSDQKKITVDGGEKTLYVKKASVSGNTTLTSSGEQTTVSAGYNPSAVTVTGPTFTKYYMGSSLPSASQYQIGDLFLVI